MPLLRKREDAYPIWQFGAREIGITAAFGGLAFATRALGIVIPVGAVINIDPRDLFWILGSALGGPISGLVIGILSGIPSGLPVGDIVHYALVGFLIGLAFRTVGRPWYHVALAILLLIWDAVVSLIYGPIFQYLTFGACMVSMLTITAVYFPIAVIVIEVIRRYAPAIRKMIG
jgi:hypothetical protein